MKLSQLRCIFVAVTSELGQRCSIGDGASALLLYDVMWDFFPKCRTGGSTLREIGALGLSRTGGSIVDICIPGSLSCLQESFLAWSGSTELQICLLTRLEECSTLYHLPSTNIRLYFGRRDSGSPIFGPTLERIKPRTLSCSNIHPPRQS